MNITTQMIKELREATGAGVLECKNILHSVEGDFEKAVQVLREKGLAKAAKRAGREASEGVIEMYAHHGNTVGVMLELNCETDFVARTDNFKTLAHDLALHIAALHPKYVQIKDIPGDVVENEKQVLLAQVQSEGKPEHIAEKIVDGRLQKFYEENCLMEQPFVKDDSIKISDLITQSIATVGENIIVRRFERYALGEPL